LKNSAVQGAERLEVVVFAGDQFRLHAAICRCHRYKAVSQHWLNKGCTAKQMLAPPIGVLMHKCNQVLKGTQRGALPGSAQKKQRNEHKSAQAE
jgi:hypothetical protein